jgi:hypothetical protein
MKFESLNNTSPENSLEKKQKLWDEKMAQLLVPDKYGYVLDEGMRQPVIALNLLGINTGKESSLLIPSRISECPGIKCA